MHIYFKLEQFKVKSLQLNLIANIFTFFEQQCSQLYNFDKLLQVGQCDDRQKCCTDLFISLITFLTSDVSTSNKHVQKREDSFSKRTKVLLLVLGLTLTISLGGLGTLWMIREYRVSLLTSTTSFEYICTVMLFNRQLLAKINLDVDLL